MAENQLNFTSKPKLNSQRLHLFVEFFSINAGYLQLGYWSTHCNMTNTEF